jgi:hypothetical protein
MTRFYACRPSDVRAAVLHTLAFRRLPTVAERDVYAALERVDPASQQLLIQAAEDAALNVRVALERLSCLWMLAATVNLADDLADGDCDYLEPRVAPGVSFLLHALSGVCAARSELSPAAWADYSEYLAQAAAGQCLEVRAARLDAAGYLEIARLIAGRQYAAYLRILWDGSRLADRALPLGLALGTVGLVMTDVVSNDRRLTEMRHEERETVLKRAAASLDELTGQGLACLDAFSRLAKPLLAGTALPRPDETELVKEPVALRRAVGAQG